MHTATVVSLLLLAPFGTLAQRTSEDGKSGGSIMLSIKYGAPQIWDGQKDGVFPSHPIG
jgi:hypothetical protein